MPGLISGETSAGVAAPVQVDANGAVVTTPSGGSTPVTVSGTPSVNVANTPKVNALNYSTVSSGRATNANLTANQRYNSSVVDSGTDPLSYPTRIRPAVRYLAGLIPGLLILEESLDGATWLETRRQPIPSDGRYHTFDWPLHLRYWRIGFQNGATATTVFDLLFNTTRGDGASVDVRNVLTFPLTNTPLAANGQWTSPTLDLGDNNSWNVARLFATADTGGTVFFQVSDDGASWKSPSTGNGTAVGTNSAADNEIKLSVRYLRIAYTNGTTAQTAFRVALTLVSL